MNFKFWKTKDRAPLIHDAFNEVYGMVQRAEGMFQSACQSLFGEPGEVEAAHDVAGMDEDIDYAERVVRRLVFEHLSMNPSQDLTASLVLVSIVHDIERTGDYVKSLSYLSTRPTTDSSSKERCKSIAGRIRPLFGDTLRALREGNEELAHSVMSEHAVVKADANQFLQDLLSVESEAGVSHDALVWSIGAQYLRRISAHLSNIASSVTNPFDRLGGREV